MMLFKSLSAVLLLCLVAVSTSHATWEQEENTPAKLEYEGVIDEIKQVISGNKFRALRKGVENYLTPLPEYSKYARTPDALAAGLKSVPGNSKLTGSARQTRFYKLFEDYVTEPCKKVKVLKSKLDTVIRNHPVLDSDNFKHIYVPEGFNRMNDLCEDLYKNTRISTFRRFKS